MTPRVSVIIPTYNNAHFIAQAIESVLAQSFDSYEVIVIDDGSTDDTHELVGRFGAPVRYEKQANAGVSAARNHGINMARGDLVVFLDADDTFYPDKLARQSAMFDADAKLGVVNSGWDIVGESGDVLRERRPWEETPRLDLLAWLTWKPVFPGALMVRHDWLVTVGGFDTNFSQAEDVDLVLRLSLAGAKAAWLHEPTATYRQHAGNAMNNALAQAHGIYAVLEKFFNLPGLPRRIVKREPWVKHYTYLWAAWYLYQAGHRNAVVEFLHHTFQHTRHEADVLVAHWAGQFVRHSARAGDGHEETISMLPLFKQAAGVSDEHWPDVEQALTWWLGVWWYYHDERYEQAARQLGTFADLDRPRLIETAQRCLLISPLSISARQINRFWSDALSQGLMGAAQRHDRTMFHLSGFAHHVWARRWWSACVALGWSVGTSWHPRSWPAWLRFTRTALVYYLGQPRRGK